MTTENTKHITIPVQPLATAYRLVCGGCRMGEMTTDGTMNDEGTEFKHVCTHCGLVHYSVVRFPSVYLDAEKLSPQVYATLNAPEKAPN